MLPPLAPENQCETRKVTAILPPIDITVTITCLSHSLHLHARSRELLLT